MSTLDDKWIDQVTLKLCEEYPLLDFSFQDGYTEEMKLILEAAYRETLKMVGDWGNKFCVNTEHYGISKYANKRQRECRQCWESLNDLEVSNGH